MEFHISIVHMQQVSGVVARGVVPPIHIRHDTSQADDIRLVAGDGLWHLDCDQKAVVVLIELATYDFAKSGQASMNKAGGVGFDVVGRMRSFQVWSAGKFPNHPKGMYFAEPKKVSWPLAVLIHAFVLFQLPHV